MSELNIKRFSTLLECTHNHPGSKYLLYDNEGRYVEATYDTDFESDNGLEEDEDGYEEYQCILFKRVSDGVLVEVNFHQIPVKVICDGQVLYD